MLKSLMVRMNDSTIVTISTCLSPGSVTCRKRCQAPAPSTEAASYSSRGIACIPARYDTPKNGRSEEHTSELQSLAYLVCRLLLEKKNKINLQIHRLLS